MASGWGRGWDRTQHVKYEGYSHKAGKVLCLGTRTESWALKSLPPPPTAAFATAVTITISGGYGGCDRKVKQFKSGLAPN